MKFAYIALFWLTAVLLAAPAGADEVKAPDSAQRKSMSYREYNAYRETMRKRMEEQAAPQSAETKKAGETEGTVQDEPSRYGQGYDARHRGDQSAKSDSPDRVDRADRPDRPDRPDHPDRPERPERPERPDRPER